jgi:glutamyl-Q tRNA(Asp) synthetase
LHLGHAYAAIFAHEIARAADGRFLLRIEDIDAGRCRPEFDAAIEEDLAWLGLEWETPVRRQSQHMEAYRAALVKLDAAGLIYPCFCTRAEIAQATAAPQGPDGPIYPGTCRALSTEVRTRRIEAGAPYALRLDMMLAASRVGALQWRDRARGIIDAAPERFGDVVDAGDAW